MDRAASRKIGSQRTLKTIFHLPHSLHARSGVLEGQASVRVQTRSKHWLFRHRKPALLQREHTHGLWRCESQLGQVAADDRLTHLWCDDRLIALTHNIKKGAPSGALFCRYQYVGSAGQRVNSLHAFQWRLFEHCDDGILRVGWKTDLRLCCKFSRMGPFSGDFGTEIVT